MSSLNQYIVNTIININNKDKEIATHQEKIKFIEDNNSTPFIQSLAFGDMEKVISDVRRKRVIKELAISKILEAKKLNFIDDFKCNNAIRILTNIIKG